MQVPEKKIGTLNLGTKHGLYVATQSNSKDNKHHNALKQYSLHEYRHTNSWAHLKIDNYNISDI